MCVLFIYKVECEAIVPDYKNYKKVNKPKQLSGMYKYVPVLCSVTSKFC